MRTLQHSSGDLLADRRAAYAAAMAESGDFAAAADIMAQALDRVPDWTAGWSRLADYAERGGDLATAIGAWQRLIALDGEGVFGARLKLAAYQAGQAAMVTDAAYVEALFDDYASRFDASLLQRLNYDVPRRLTELVRDRLEARGLEQVAGALDLGCGTGLMGERLRRFVSHLEGVDLSAGMIAESARKGIYDRLVQGELTAFLAAHPGGADLVAAADVLNYCGALGPVLAAVARALAPGGMFVFSLEAHVGPEPVVLRPSLRYAHEADASRSALRAAGLEVLSFEAATLRLDRGVPVEGYLVLARRPVEAARLPAVGEGEAAEPPILVH